MNRRAARGDVRRHRPLDVVVFTGGRGSGVLSRQLINHPEINLTLAINGYDDGASTGEVRRFLGDCLGPSDYRKNASRLARELRTCDDALIELLDCRLPIGSGPQEARALFSALGTRTTVQPSLMPELSSVCARLFDTSRQAVHARLRRFEEELQASGRSFDFSDCSVGNLVFAGGYLEAGRDFNLAIEDYCALLGLPRQGLVENVTDGTNAHLVALDVEGAVLGSEAEIVDASRANRIREIFLIASPLSDAEIAALSSGPPEPTRRELESRTARLAINPRIGNRLVEADLIVYAPGTQHSSLFPSYLTPGLTRVIAGNLTALKILITNIQADAEIADSSAVDIIERAVYYLKEKGRLSTPTPCLITHYVINDPGRPETATPYVPLGPVEHLEDPRLVRIANYEDGVTGRHDASKILTPFIESFLARRQPAVAVLLYDADSANKLTQTVLEMVRGGLGNLPLAVTVLYTLDQPIDASFAASLPFATRNLPPATVADPAAFRAMLRDGGFDYLLMFESSGMYRGEDVVGLAGLLTRGRLDAVWGSRRLSVKDIHESYRLRYRRHLLLGAASYLGSHALSAAYLFLYGRYISDTLSGARAVRAEYAAESAVPVAHKRVNQHLLSSLLRDRAEILEVPVQFFPISPERVRRTTVLDGLQSLATSVAGRFAGNRRVTASPRPEPVPAPASHDARFDA